MDCISVCELKKQPKKKTKMAYGKMNEEQLRELLAKRDEEVAQQEQEIAQIERELADAKKKNPGGIPQVICMAPSIPLPAQWNLKARDSTESFKDFKRGWENYIQASPSTAAADERVKVGIFWAAIGPEAMKKCEEEWKFEDPDKASINSIITKIESKLKTERLPIIDRINFQSCKRNVEEGETIADFVSRTEKLADYCNYGDRRNELLLQQVLCGMRDLEFQRELLTKKDLDWNLAKQTILAKKNTDSQLEVMNPTNPKAETVGKIQSDFKQMRKCCYCGLKHKKGKEQCPAYGKSCSYCEKPNHFETVCKQKTADNTQDSDGESEEEKQKKKKKSEKKDTEKKQKLVKKTRMSESSSDSEIFTIRKLTSQSMEVSALLDLKVDRGWKPVSCLLDTGSSCNLIGIKDLKKVIENPKISPTTSKMRDIQNRPIKSIGECAIKGTKEGKKFQLIFQVIKARVKPLLSENACSALNLIQYDQSVVSKQSKFKTQNQHATNDSAHKGAKKTREPTPQSENELNNNRSKTKENSNSIARTTEFARIHRKNLEDKMKSTQHKINF